ncbi:unnamed protein product [Colias eurytheme]|nr:unnamed protein product [Colias eurytheme]
MWSSLLVLTSLYCIKSLPIDNQSAAKSMMEFMKSYQDLMKPPTMKAGGLNSTNGPCCFGQICTNPCTYPILPNYQQMPIILPARTVYEPVEHNHPPLGDIKDLIEADKKRHNYVSYEFSDTSSETDTDTDTNTDSDTDYAYYESFLGKVS